MEMRFWKPFPRPDLFEIVTSQVDLVLLNNFTTFSVTCIDNCA